MSKYRDTAVTAEEFERGIPERRNLSRNIQYETDDVVRSISRELGIPKNIAYGMIS